MFKTFPVNIAAINPTKYTKEYLLASKTEISTKLLQYSYFPEHNVQVIKPFWSWTCNPATLEAEFRNGVGSITVEGNSPSIGGSIV